MPSNLIAMSLGMPNILSNSSNNINQILSPDESGNISFNINNIENSINSNMELSDNYELSDNLFKIRISHYILVSIICVLLVLYIFKNKDIIYKIFQSGLIVTSLQYPVIPMLSLIFNMCMIVTFIHKNTMKVLNDINKNAAKENYNNIKNSMNKELKYKTAWDDISGLCNSNIETIFSDIINDFQNEDINKNYNEPLTKYLIIDEDKIKKVVTDINTNYSLDIKTWRLQLDTITKIFSDKYKKYKDIEVKLLKIKDQIKELTDWTKSTEKLLSSFKDKKNEDIKNTIETYVKNKITELNYPNYINEYQSLYLELKVLIKYLQKNPESEIISKCPICLTNLKDSFIVPCGHCACKDCFDQQYKIDKKIICPICRCEGSKISKIFY